MINLFQAFLARIFGQHAPVRSVPGRVGDAITLAPAQSAGGQKAVNDAAAYGVQVEPAVAAAGAWYWQAARVHHLTSEENHGNHHLYLDVLDSDLAQQANLTGQRAFGAQIRITWEGGEQVVTIDKPLTEPGAIFPLWRGQVSAVTALGLPGQELPSDRVTGLQTDHPDEAPGNTVVNHSFSVTFVKAKATAGGDVNTPIPAASAISGRVRSGTGRTVQLIRDAAEASAAGTAGCAIASDESYHFSGLAAGAYRVVVAGTPIVSDTLTLDGTNTLIADLVVPTAGKPLAHYVLFGPAAHPTTKAHLLLAQDYLLAFGPSFGFSAIEATVADLVTIVGGTDATSAESEAALVASGATVQRIAGTPAEVAAALTRRITAGRPF